MKIIELRAENVKRLHAVHIKPDGSLFVVGGKNGAGKTSVLDSVAYALGGKDLICEQPLRKGKAKGFVSVDLGDLKVTRTFTAAGGGSLKVESPDGTPHRSPQAMLDALVGRLSFDPLAFSRMEPRQQQETLKALVGLDFTEVDAKRAGLYDERRDVNRRAKQLEGRLAGMTRHEDAPAEEVSVFDLTAELEKASEEALRVDGLRADQEAAQLEASAARQRMEETAEEIRVLRHKLVRLAAEEDSWRNSIPGHEQRDLDLGKAIVDAEPALPDRDAIRARIGGAEDANRQVRENAAHAEQAAELKGSREQAATLTEKIDALDVSKAEQIAAAEFQVEGLGFDEGGVSLEGIPFSQASSAEQLRVSVGMGLAMNPKLRVLLIRDGSLLDEDSLRLVAEMAEIADAQVWIERVGEDEATSIVIDDGAVKGAKERAA